MPRTSVLESLMILSELGARAPVLLAKAVDADGSGAPQPPLEPARQGLSVWRVLRKEDLALSIHEGVARTVLESFCEGLLETFNPPGILRSAIRFLCHQAPPWTCEGLGEPERGRPGFVRFAQDLAPAVGSSPRNLRKEPEGACEGAVAYVATPGAGGCEGEEEVGGKGHCS